MTRREMVLGLDFPRQAAASLLFLARPPFSDAWNGRSSYARSRTSKQRSSGLAPKY